MVIITKIIVNCQLVNLFLNANKIISLITISKRSITLPLRGADIRHIATNTERHKQEISGRGWWLGWHDRDSLSVDPEWTVGGNSSLRSSSEGGEAALR